MPYGFNEEVEFKIYSQIGELYRETVLGKNSKKQDKNIPSFNTYLEWKEYFINKFFRSFDWNCNFTHYLNRKRRTNEKIVDLIKSVVVPIYIGEISCLITIYQSNEIQISICTEIIMLLSAIIITVISSFWLIHKYTSRTQFYMDCIGIIKKKYQSS